MRVAMLAVLGMLGGSGQAAQDAEHKAITAYEGSCSADSVTYVGSPEASVRTPYACNAVIHMIFDDDPRHQMFIFARKGDDTSLLAMGGRIDDAGNLQLANVQFEQRKGTPLESGECRIAREKDAITHIRCAAKASDGSKREAMIDYEVTGVVQ